MQKIDPRKTDLLNLNADQKRTICRVFGWIILAFGLFFSVPLGFFVFEIKSQNHISIEGEILESECKLRARKSRRETDVTFLISSVNGERKYHYDFNAGVHTCAHALSMFPTGSMVQLVVTEKSDSILALTTTQEIRNYDDFISGIFRIAIKIPIFTFIICLPMLIYGYNYFGKE